MGKDGRGKLSFIRRHSRELTAAAAVAGIVGGPVAMATNASAAESTAEMHKVVGANWSHHHHKQEAPAAVPPQVAAPVTTPYTVVPGDNLWDIAGKHLGANLAWHQIYDLNKGKVQPDGGALENPDLIRPGWVLDLPVAAAPAPAAQGGSDNQSGGGGGSDQGSGGGSSTGSDQGGSGSSAGTGQQSNGMYTPVIAPDDPGSASGYAAHDPSYWVPLIQQAEQIVPLAGGDQTDSVVQRILIESSGNPNAENDSDSNAAMGDPSRGLMQTIGATFNAYHVSGTSDNIFDPLANIAAALNYINSVYGGVVPLGSSY